MDGGEAVYAQRASRVILTVVGLLILAAGVAGLLAGAGVLGSGIANRNLLANPVARYIGRHDAWVWPLAAAVAFVVACAALWWLLAMLFASGHLDEVRIAAPGETGRTRLSADALTDAVDDEIEGYPGVRGSHSRLLGDEHRPRLSVRVQADRDTNLGALCQRLEAGALAHARSALSSPDLPIRLDIEVSRHAPSRVA